MKQLWINLYVIMNIQTLLWNGSLKQCLSEQLLENGEQGFPVRVSFFTVMYQLLLGIGVITKLYYFLLSILQTPQLLSITISWVKVQNHDPHHHWQNCEEIEYIKLAELYCLWMSVSSFRIHLQNSGSHLYACGPSSSRLFALVLAEKDCIL